MVERARLGADIDAARRFLDALGIDEPLFQTFDDTRGRDDKSLVRVVRGSLKQRSLLLDQLNHRGAGIFVLLNKHDGGHRHRRDNITGIRAIPLDLDGAPLEPVRKCALKPQLIVETSKGRFHAYWIVEDRFPLEAFEPMVKAVADRFGGDPAIAKLPLVVRVPGFDHRKDGRWFRTRIIELNDTPPYPRDLVEAQFPLPGCAATSGTLDKRTSSQRGPTQVDRLIAIAGDAALFHDGEGTAYADLRVRDHSETHRVRDKSFRFWLLGQYYNRTKSAPTAESLTMALRVIEAKALNEGPRREVYVRVGMHEGKIYLDLGDEDWNCVECDTRGWRVTQEPPLRFRRSKEMRALPIPVHGASVNELRPLINVRSDDDFALVVSWLVGALYPSHPKPPLNFSGEQGAAKTSASRTIKNLLDPRKGKERSLPRDERDLAISARHTYVLSFDNVSRLSDEMSNALCRLATGSGFATRTLYTDDDEEIFEATRPIVLNGIDEVARRPDLTDRSIFIRLEPIDAAHRLDEETLSARFEAARPRILGALLDAAVMGLRNLPATRPNTLSRMADFERWVQACEPALPWPEGAFVRAYRANRAESTNRILSDDVLATQLADFVSRQAEKRFEGSASVLLRKLTAVVARIDESLTKSRDWPSGPGGPRALASRLRHLAPALRTMGVIVKEPDRKDRDRVYTITLDLSLFRPPQTENEQKTPRGPRGPREPRWSSRGP